MQELDEKFLDYIIKALVEHPDDVKIARTVDEMGVLLTLDVHREDMGKVIGRAGNTAKAIRTLLRVIGMKNNARVNLKVAEPIGGTGPTNTSGSGGFGGGPTSGPSTPPISSVSAADAVDEAMADLKADPLA